MQRVLLKLLVLAVPCLQNKFMASLIDWFVQRDALAELFCFSRQELQKLCPQRSFVHLLGGASNISSARPFSATFLQAAGCEPSRCHSSLATLPAITFNFVNWDGAPSSRSL